MPHFYIMDKSNHLAHYGIKGQRRGVRRFQNYDGTYTPEGLERYWPGSKHGTRGGLFSKSTKSNSSNAMEPSTFEVKGEDGKVRKYVHKPVDMKKLATETKAVAAKQHADFMDARKQMGDLEEVKALASNMQFMYDKLTYLMQSNADSKKVADAYDDFVSTLTNGVADAYVLSKEPIESLNDLHTCSNGDQYSAYGLIMNSVGDVCQAEYIKNYMNGHARGGHERGAIPIAAAFAFQAAWLGIPTALYTAHHYKDLKSIETNCADWPQQKTEVRLASLFGRANIENNRNMAAQVIRKMPTDVDGSQLSKDIAAGKDLKDLPSIKSLANDIQFEFNSAMDRAIYSGNKHSVVYEMARRMKPKYVKGLDHSLDKQVSSAIYEANAEAYKQYNPSVEGQELPKIRGGHERGGEIRTFETSKFGDTKQKSSYISGTDIHNGILKATKANNENTVAAANNAIKALKSNKSIQDIAQLAGKAYHEYVVEQADYNHVSNKKTIPLLYSSKTKQSDMQASHEKLGKSEAVLSSEIRSMMRIALEKDYNKKTPYTSNGKPITYGELANKAVMQILKESNSKANRKDMLNVTLAARDYNRKQARRGSTVDEAKLERQRSEISKLRGKVYDEWGNIIDQKAYKQLQRAKANYKKTKQG